jgi:hypothetical protein
VEARIKEAAMSSATCTRSGTEAESIRRVMRRPTTRERFAREARKLGVRPTDLYTWAREARRLRAAVVDETNAAITRAKTLYSHHNSKQLRRTNRAFRGGDHTQLRHWDTISRTVARAFPGVFSGVEKRATEQFLFDLIASDRPQRLSCAESYQAARDYFAALKAAVHGVRLGKRKSAGWRTGRRRRKEQAPFAVF